MKKTILLLSIFAYTLQLHAQEPSSLSELEDSTRTEVVTSHFKSTRVINTHSVEMLKKGNLDFRILHRFGRVSGGLKQFFGLDQATMRMSFDYGLSDKVMIGIGRSTFRKELDIFMKTSIVRQTTGIKNFPFTLVAAVGAMTWTEPSFAVIKPTFSDRSSFYGQLLMSRKFNSKFTLQLNSILLRQNYVLTAEENNTIISTGIGARYKVSNRVALMADYNYVASGLASGATQPLSLGVDIETGGHVFQLHFSNAVGMNERAFLTQTRDEFFKGDMRFGFNLSRIFQPGKKRRASVNG